MGKERVGLYIMVILILLQTCAINTKLNTTNEKLQTIEQSIIK